MYLSLVKKEPSTAVESRQDFTSEISHVREMLVLDMIQDVDYTDLFNKVQVYLFRFEQSQI